MKKSNKVLKKVFKKMGCDENAVVSKKSEIFCYDTFFKQIICRFLLLRKKSTNGNNKKRQITNQIFP